MSVIVVLIIFSVLVAIGFLIAFIWAVKSGQYDDTDSPAVRMLFDDSPQKKKKKEEKTEESKSDNKDLKN